MKRMHIHVGVESLNQGVTFYSALFGAEPTTIKDDYAKWMLEDPRVNFAISTRGDSTGVDHLGIQVDDDAELDGVRERLKTADVALFDEGETVCCYARSEKSWVEDPAGVAWETFKTMEQAEFFGQVDASTDGACCAPQESPKAAEKAITSGGCC
ncbi:glyoxalase/bleomycin resistance/dioxygenase family protein [Halieaceae bacterium IMCC14734]|uniref:Glyoxalase/bleomycin resistance/dioxygenase family protein n=1 Tax=Candidatus Litorirhabdus singularis TaxID=2518993 RepID=A0ABT3TDF1_9GAMM|nr:ArsI/CadI family heavy metal resistance metalloenzyme [Candidatus Litorirhabdus singularis]MCX2979850.1 glyoxalase/bleomycin resistance/dioxygenase family protein [Candidatus Litorirhabdus singularis]